MFSCKVYAEDTAPDCISLSQTNIVQRNETYGDTTDNYITISNGNYMKVEAHTRAAWVVVSYFDKDFNLIERKLIPEELSMFGAFYETNDYYFIISGDSNLEESDEVEVFRITKYDKEWNRISSCGLFGANTRGPFSYGNCSVAVEGSYMVVHTSHIMYTTSDGYTHQANLTFKADIDSMEITDSFYKISYEAYGYVSHSYNQFVKVDNNKMITLDHGDSAPRSAVIMQYPLAFDSGKFVSNKVSKIDVIDFPYGGTDSYITGVSLGGFEITDSSYIIAGNSVTLDDNYLSRSTRNIFVAIVDKETNDITQKWITDYSEGEPTACIPHMVKVNNNKFFLIWYANNKISYVLIDGNGNKISDIHTSDGFLSDCVPLLDGNDIVWHTRKNQHESFYRINLNDLDNIEISEKLYGHDFSVLSTDGDMAVVKCNKCGFTTNALIPISFSPYWYYSSGSSGSVCPRYMDVGETLGYRIDNVKYNGDTENTFCLEDFVVEFDDPEAGEIIDIDKTIIWKKTGLHSITIYPKGNPSVKKTNRIIVRKPLTNVKLSVDKDKIWYGDDVTLSVSKEDGRGQIAYQFVLVRPDGTERILQEYSLDNSCKWTVDEVGKFTIRADVKDVTPYYPEYDEEYSDSIDDITIGIPDVILSDESKILTDNTLTYGQRIKDLKSEDFVFINSQSMGNIPGDLTIDDKEAIPHAGSYSVHWTFVPEDTNYKSINGYSNITVGKADMVFDEFPQIEDITYNPNTTLADIIIPGVEQIIDGDWQWMDATVVPTVNVHEYSAVYVSDDPDYNSYECKITINVKKAVPYVYSVNAGSIAYGYSLSEASLSGIATYSETDDSVVRGSFKWKNDYIVPDVSDSNNVLYEVIFIPDDNINYESVELSQYVTVEKAENIEPVIYPGSDSGVITEPHTETLENTQETNKTIDYTIVPAMKVNETPIKKESETVAVTETEKETEKETETEFENDRLPLLKNQERIIASLSDNGDVSNSKYSELQLMEKKTGKNYITLRWNKIRGASSYLIYGNKCGKKYKYEKIVSVSSKKTSYKLSKLADNKKLNSGTYYKFLIIALTKNGDGEYTVLEVSKSVHIATKGGKYTNYSKVKLKSKKNVNLTTGEKCKINTSLLKNNGLKLKQHRKLQYESTDLSVAAVSKRGVITAKEYGQCKIYIYSQNGKCAVVNVNVSEN